jgi:ABC-type amino acid transport substrate-binding protein
MAIHPIRRLGALLSLAAVLFSPSAHADLAQLRQSGMLKVAVYKDMPPFSDKSGGIDIDFAKALSAKLGLKLSLLPFDAGENLNDDLRNMVWKGHYLGYGPADVLMHVPVDRRLMEDNRRVEILAPYHREQVRLVRDVRRLPVFDGIDALAGRKVGVEKISIAAMVLLGEQGGKFRDDVRIFPSASEALNSLKAGELDAVLANRSEIESAIGADANFTMSDVAFPRLPPQGWVVGMAVKKGDVELAKALQGAVNEMVESGELAGIFSRHGGRFVKP